MVTQLKRMRISVDGKNYDVTVEVFEDAGAAVRSQSPALATPTVPSIAGPSPVAAAPLATAGSGTVVCPLSGVVAAIHVQMGQAVKSGDLLLTLEAMKMNTAIRAPRAGTVGQIYAQIGAAVEEGAGLMLIA